MLKEKPLKQTEAQRQALAEYWQRVKSLSMEQVQATVQARPPKSTEKLLASSRLTRNEQTYTFDSLKANLSDGSGEIVVIRHALRRLVENPIGWWMLVGPPGNAKSLALSIAVAECCRGGIEARYYNISEVDRATKPPAVHDDGVVEYEGNPDAFKQMAKRLPVLAIDECDKINWSPWQVQHIGEILEDRHRNQDKRLTLFAANLPPTLWANADNITHLTSRFNDGRFRMVWGGDRVPRCLSNSVDDSGRHVIPAIFTLTLGDVRPSLPAKEN